MGAILVTGATGNVGREVVKQLLEKGEVVRTGLFSIWTESLPDSSEKVRFDFADPRTYESAFNGVDRLFLMRPPQISEVEKYLFPVINFSLAKGIKQIVFLSLQGVQFNIFTPHHKVEKYLRKMKAPFTFIRPNFYMQNLSTFYKEDVRDRSEIFLPAGKGRTAFVDVRDIGEVVARVLTEAGHLDRAYTLSGPESLDYWQIAKILSETLGRDIRYINPSVGQYVKRLSEANTDPGFIRVQKMLFFVVRHNFSASTKSDAQDLLGRTPTTFEAFANDYRDCWQKIS